MKNLKTFEQFVNESVNEGSYEDFISEYGREVKNNLTKLFKIAKDARSGKVSNNRIDIAMDHIEKIYDKINVGIIESIIYGGQKPDVREITNTAIDMQNRTGTEMSMVVQCMEDFLGKVK